jgi:xanthine dehydrogenase accessory factor
MAMTNDLMSRIILNRALSKHEIYAEMKRRLEQGDKAVMATIVRAKGSTPQQVGAKIVVFDDGTFIGTVGGGCVEADIYAEAKEVMRSGRAGIFHFNLAGDIAANEGMVCGGNMDVFIEPWTLEDFVQLNFSALLN